MLGKQFKKFLLEEVGSVDHSVFFENFFSVSGMIGGLSLGMSLEEVNTLGFEPESFGEFEHSGRIGKHGWTEGPKQLLEYALEDENLESIIYEFHSSDADVIAAENRFADELTNELGDPIVFENAKHWMLGTDAQFILGHDVESVENDDGDEFGFSPGTVKGHLSLQLWSGDGGEFPASFDATEIQYVLRTFLTEKYGDKIELGELKIWKESMYVYFNIKLLQPEEEELILDCEGVPLTDGKLDPSFQELVIDEIDGVLAYAN